MRPPSSAISGNWYTAESGYCLDQEILPFAVQLGGQNTHSRRVAAGLGQRAHQSCPYHVVGYCKDRNRRRRLLSGANCDISGAKNDIGFRFNQLHRNVPKVLGARSIAAPIDRKVLTLDEAELAQLVEKRGIMRGVARTRGQATEPIGSPRLLRSQLERPSRRRASEQRDELAPFH